MMSAAEALTKQEAEKISSTARTDAIMAQCNVLAHLLVTQLDPPTDGTEECNWIGFDGYSDGRMVEIKLRLVPGFVRPRL